MPRLEREVRLSDASMMSQELPQQADLSFGPVLGDLAVFPSDEFLLAVVHLLQWVALLFKDEVAPEAVGVELIARPGVQMPLPFDLHRRVDQDPHRFVQRLETLSDQVIGEFGR